MNSVSHSQETDNSKSSDGEDKNDETRHDSESSGEEENGEIKRSQGTLNIPSARKYQRAATRPPPGTVKSLMAKFQ